MGKLHELLAVEPELKDTAKRVVQSVVKNFAQAQKFVGHSKVYNPLEEDGQTFPDDVQPMATTVVEQLEQVSLAVGAWIDVAIQKEVTNQIAESSAMIGNKDYTLPATAWLALEDKLRTIKGILGDIPTNDQSIEWHWDANNEFWRSVPITTFKTEKVVEPIVGYPATEEHPAQLQWVPKDVRVGEWFKVIYSGMISARQKRAMLAKVDVLLQEAKRARQRANQAEVESVKVSESIFEFIFSDLEPF